MKYALIIVAALIILRIDMFIGVVERAWEKIPSWQQDELPPSVISPTNVESMSIGDVGTDVVSQLQVLLTEFSFNPDRTTRELIESYIKSNPRLQSINASLLYTEMEKWIPAISGDNVEIPLLLNGLLELFKGERAQVIMQFYSLYLERSPEFFIHYYPHLKDPNCIVIKYAWNNQNTLSREQIFLRKKQLADLSGKVPSDKLEFAKSCQLVLRVEESKITPDADSL